jgi:uncharacterized protein (TIGR03435 family)
MLKPRALWFICASAVLCCIGAVLFAQQAPASPTFEVASIKQNKSGDPRLQMGFEPGGRFNAVNISIRNLISIAYITARPALPGLRIVGGPAWMDSARFDIVAKTEGQYQPGSDVPLLRNLLTERFKLKVHIETKELPVYALVLARQDRRLGPRLTPSSINCDVVNGRGGLPGTPNQAASSCRALGAFGRISGMGLLMSQLAGSLSGPVNAIVLDRTGLDGVFDLNLEFTPDQAASGGQPVALDTGPSIFTAVQEQLGLKLESTKGPVEVVVIDHVEPPTED